MYRIYIAEDDESIAAAIARGLSAWDFEVRTASDFKRIADEIAEYDRILFCSTSHFPSTTDSTGAANFAVIAGSRWCSYPRRRTT